VTGPKVVKGDPAATKGSSAHVDHHQHSPIISTAFDVSDSALKFIHVLYNLSPAGIINLYIIIISGSLHIIF